MVVAREPIGAVAANVFTGTKLSPAAGQQAVRDSGLNIDLVQDAGLGCRGDGVTTGSGTDPSATIEVAWRL